MKIHMGNVGMTLHVIHTLRARGITNVQVNMDWQHLIMNGENLAEYAALLHAEGLLGHQHANSGWGTFDDDNMVGATAFMETLELAVELRRAGYGERGERLGFDLYPYTEDAVEVVKRSVLQWRFIDGAAARIDDAALREAQARKDAIRAYELVYAALGARGVEARAWHGERVTLLRPRHRHVVGQGAARLARRRRGARARRGRAPLCARRGPGWAEQDPEDWWAGAQAVLAQLGRAGAIGAIGLTGQMHGLVALDAAGRGAAPGDALERRAHRRRVRGDRADASASSGSSR